MRPEAVDIRYDDGSQAAADYAERSHSEQLDRFKAEFFHEIGCEGEWGEKWSVGGPADEVIERLQKFHKMKFYKADPLSDIPF